MTASIQQAAQCSNRPRDLLLWRLIPLLWLFCVACSPEEPSTVDQDDEMVDVSVSITPNTTDSVSTNSTSGSTTIVQIAAGSQHSALLTADGSVYSCGLGGNGQLGWPQNEYCYFPVPVEGLPPIVKVAAGSSMSLYLSEDGELWGAGYGADERLGPMPTTDVSTPVALGISNVIDIAVDTNFTIIRKDDGSVSTFGVNDAGGLGHGSLQDSAIPVDLGFRAKAIAAGGSSAFALLEDGTIRSWGGNNYANLGNPDVPSMGFSNSQTAAASRTFSLVPVTVVLDSVVALAAGNNHTLAVREDGSVWGWGHNAEFALGIQDGAQSHPTPVQIAGLSDIQAVAAGRGYSLALSQSGDVYSWGNSSQGKLGRTGSMERTRVPTRIAGLSAITKIVAGPDHAFAIDREGRGYGWGLNAYGELMSELGEENQLKPVAVTFRSQ
ncbi:MAG: RCC1 domain-containing protein [Pseudomonadales bacterium]